MQWEAGATILRGFRLLEKSTIFRNFLQNFRAKRFLTWWFVEVKYRVHHRRVGTLIVSTLRGASNLSRTRW